MKRSTVTYTNMRRKEREGQRERGGRDRGVGGAEGRAGMGRGGGVGGAEGEGWQRWRGRRDRGG